MKKEPHFVRLFFLKNYLLLFLLFLRISMKSIATIAMDAVIATIHALALVLSPVCGTFGS